MRRTIFAVALALGLWQHGAATAATLDFDAILLGGLQSGPAGSLLDLGDATLSVTSDTGTIFIFNSDDYGPPVQDGGAFCAVIGDGTFGDRCTGSASIVFLRPVSDVSFTALYVGPGDGATVTAYAGTDLLASVAITAVGEVLGLIGLEGITRLDFVDTSVPGPDRLVEGQPVRVGTGIAYTGIDYTVLPDPPVVIAPIPLPAGGWLVLSALASLAFLRRRRP